jgi:hypothetical protein
MSEKASILMDQTDYIYERIVRTLEGLSEKEMKWKPTEFSNSQSTSQKAGRTTTAMCTTALRRCGGISRRARSWFSRESVS